VLTALPHVLEKEYFNQQKQHRNYDIRSLSP
jgi:hypothetical protein